MKIAIVTDSTAYFTKEERDNCQFTIVPLSVNFSDESFAEGTKYGNAEFFAKLRNTKAFPTSSQPAIGAFAEVYKELLKEYDEIISIHISGNLSGTVQSAMGAAELVDKKRIFVIDSLSAAQGLAAMVVKACSMTLAGKATQEIITEIMRMVNNTPILFLIETLDYLHKGGRIGGAATLFGNLLQIRPILYVNDAGKVGVLDKVRTSKKAEARLIQIAIDEVNKLGAKNVTVNVIHADNLSRAKQLYEQFVQVMPGCKTRISELGPVIGMHVGPGTCGFIIALD